MNTCADRTGHPPGAPSADGGFTFVDLLAVLAAVVLLSALAAPVFAHPRLRSDRVVCANNLRQIGVAMQLWANDHEDAIPPEVPLAEGGTFGHPLAANVWLHFSWLSNELRSAQVLFCPSDQGRPARDFSGDSNSGYVHPNFANRATSYVLSHPNTGSPRNLFSTPAALLVADRNVGNDGVTSCSRFNAARMAGYYPASSFRWDTNLHNQAGNLVFSDGRVAQMNNEGLKAYLTVPPTFDNGNAHFIAPR